MKHLSSRLKMPSSSGSCRKKVEKRPIKHMSTSFGPVVPAQNSSFDRWTGSIESRQKLGPRIPRSHKSLLSIDQISSGHQLVRSRLPCRQPASSSSQSSFEHSEDSPLLNRPNHRSDTLIHPPTRTFFSKSSVDQSSTNKKHNKTNIRSNMRNIPFNPPAMSRVFTSDALNSKINTNTQPSALTTNETERQRYAAMLMNAFNDDDNTNNMGNSKNKYDDAINSDSGGGGDASIASILPDMSTNHHSTTISETTVRSSLSDDDDGDGDLDERVRYAAILLGSYTEDHPLSPNLNEDVHHGNNDDNGPTHNHDNDSRSYDDNDSDYGTWGDDQIADEHSIDENIGHMDTVGHFPNSEVNSIENSKREAKRLIGLANLGLDPDIVDGPDDPHYPHTQTQTQHEYVPKTSKVQTALRERNTLPVSRPDGSISSRSYSSRAYQI